MNTYVVIANVLKYFSITYKASGGSRNSRRGANSWGGYVSIFCMSKRKTRPYIRQCKPIATGYFISKVLNSVISDIIQFVLPKICHQVCIFYRISINLDVSGGWSFVYFGSWGWYTYTDPYPTTCAPRRCLGGGGDMSRMSLVESCYSFKTLNLNSRCWSQVYPHRQNKSIFYSLDSVHFLWVFTSKDILSVIKEVTLFIGVWIDTYVFYQSVLQKKTWIWSLCVAKT